MAGGKGGGAAAANPVQKKLVKYTDEDVSRLLQEIEVLKKERLGGHHRLPVEDLLSGLCSRDRPLLQHGASAVLLSLDLFVPFCLPTHQLGQIVLACLLMLLLWQQTLRCSLSTTWRAPSVC